MKSERSARDYVRLLRETGVVVFLIILCVVLAVRQEAFRDIENVKDVLVQISSIAVAAVGMTMIILTAGIDLSVGSVLALGACVGALAGLHAAEHGPAWLGAWHLDAALGFAAALGVGGMCGLANGLLITKVSLPPFIATLGMMSVARGLAYRAAGNEAVQVLSGMRAIAARPWGVPFPIIVMAAVFAVGWFVLRYTRFGRHVYAVGGNEEAARLSGVPVQRYKLWVYVITGGLAALSGLITAGRLGWAQPQEGEAFELDVIAAVVIGGTSLYGGQGSVAGTLLGALIIGVVRNGLNLEAVDYNMQKLILGGIIIAAVSMDVLLKRFSKNA